MKNTKGYEIYETIEKLLTEEIKDRRSELYTEQSKADKEISDLYHYIEFYSFNASQGYKLAKMLKDRLAKRREVKNELEIINRISLMPVGTICNGKGKDIIENLQDKQYTPRVLSELFEDKED